MAFFGPFNSCGPAGRQGAKVASDAELVAKTELTSKLAAFGDQTEARNDQAGISVGSRRKTAPKYE